METLTDIKAKQWLTPFKSYYVVWKLEFPDEYRPKKFGLNRTM